MTPGVLGNGGPLEILRENYMRPIHTCGLALGLILGSLLPAVAQEACTAGTKALGVSRTVEIDTSAGPKFGFQYHDQNSFLADGEVVLTFDDGPLRAYSKPVLEALAAQCTKATFFVVGRMAVADPETVKEYARRGHTVGTHTWSHANLANLTPLKARAEIEMGFSAVQQALGKPIAPFFRFPYLSYSGSMAMHLQNRQIATFSIDIDSKDFRTRDPVTVHRKVMAELARVKKGILLFHDIQPSTARALPGLLAELKAKGYRVVHMQPKVSVATVAEFDALTQKEFDKRHLASAGQPLLKRAVTWSSAGNLPTEPVSTQGSTQGPGMVQGPPLPAQKPAEPAPRPLPRGAAEQDWKTGLWGSY
jgi:peptidoglycan/xylan/chitin deacetylase (PgdA/CDA1 family)